MVSFFKISRAFSKGNSSRVITSSTTPPKFNCAISLKSLVSLSPKGGVYNELPSNERHTVVGILFLIFYFNQLQEFAWSAFLLRATLETH